MDAALAPRAMTSERWSAAINARVDAETLGRRDHPSDPDARLEHRHFRWMSDQFRDGAAQAVVVEQGPGDDGRRHHHVRAAASEQLGLFVSPPVSRDGHGETGQRRELHHPTVTGPCFGLVATR